MRRIAHLLAGTTFAAFAAPALAQGDAASTQPLELAEDAETGDQAIVITARKREESLQDVPVAVTAITGETMEQRGLASIRDVAAITPGLNISGDGVGRAFLSIRGVGTTLVQTVQPGVGLFIDGVYQPNTAFLNNPLLDVERVEVLRGPQGTLYGKNTLGGAINVISRLPGNEVEGSVMGSYALPDDSWMMSGSISGPIVPDLLQVRVAAAHRQQDGFIRNTLLGTDANRLNVDSINGTVRFEPASDVVLVVNGYYDWIRGNNVFYSRVTGPEDYDRTVQLNARNLQFYEYKRVNARLSFPIESLASEVTLIGAYDARDGRGPDTDADFSALDIARLATVEENETSSAEIRLDTTLSDTLTSLLGIYYGHETTSGNGATTIVPLNLTVLDQSATESDTLAAFGTLFWRPSDAWEVAAGLRVDNQKRNLTGATGFLGVGLTPVAEENIDETEISPRLTVTRHWSTDLMSYASVARGFRGGGFNVNPRAPNRVYSGDTVWTYEFGTKYASPDGLISLSGALFYNDYSDYIGLNSIAPLVGGGFATIDLNTGDVRSYGVEIEGVVRPTPNWTLTGGFTLMNARLTDSSAYTALTGRQLASDRIPFQPDWTVALNSVYVVPLGSGELVLTAGITGKGDRIGASLSETIAPVLDDYFLVNGAISYRNGPIELTAFVNNALQAEYFDSYIEKTTLILAGIPASDLGITGDRRRYGVRARLRF